MAETETPPESPEAKRKRRVWPVVLFYIPGWPSQDPDRRMVWRVCYDGVEKAERVIKRMRRRQPDMVWSLEHMTAAQVLALRRKPYEPPWRRRAPRS